MHGGLRQLLSQFNVNDYVASMKVFSVKPQGLIGFNYLKLSGSVSTKVRISSRTRR